MDEDGDEDGETDEDEDEDEEFNDEDSEDESWKCGEDRQPISNQQWSVSGPVAGQWQAEAPTSSVYVQQ